MNIDLLDMYSKIVNTLGESGEQYSNEAVYWNIDYDDEYYIRLILSDYDNQIKLQVDYVSIHLEGIEVINTKRIKKIIRFAEINGITIN
jgi:hypothetical protein